MTSLAQELLPWLAAFFVLDAVLQLRRGEAVLARDWPGPFRLLGPGLHLAALSPAGEALEAHHLPWLPARDALWVFDPGARGAPPVVAPEALEPVPWSALADLLADGREVRGAGRVLLRARSPAAARRLAATLAALRDAAPEAREGEVARALDRAFDLEAVRALRRRLGLPAALAGLCGAAEALLLFAALPLLAAGALGGGGAWTAWLAALAAAHLGALAAASWTLARAGAPAREIAAAIAPLALFPPHAARARAHALRERFADFEPLALGAALLPRARLLRQARAELVGAAESRAATAPLGLAAYWAARERALARLLAAAGTSPEEALAPPPAGPAAGPFCPLCACEYRAGYHRCADCGVALAPRAAGRT